MKNDTTDPAIGIAKILLAAQRKTTQVLFHAFGVIIGLALFIVNWKLNPHEGFWMPLIGVLAGTQIIGYFIAWKPFLNKRLIPFENEVIKKMQNTILNPISGSSPEKG